MKKIIENISNYLNKKSIFLVWLFVFLAVEYLLLFSLETILPGLVTEVFNLNFLLLIVVAIWVVLILSIEKSSQSLIFNRFLSVISFILLISIVVSLFFVLYKAKYWEILMYLFLVMVTGKTFYNYLKKRLFFDE